MPITLETHETKWLIRLEGELALTSAGELKARMIEGLASGIDVFLDLEKAEVDVPLLQLLVAGEREAARSGVGFSTRPGAAGREAARKAGFEIFPGEQV